MRWEIAEVSVKEQRRDVALDDVLLHLDGTPWRSGWVDRVPLELAVGVVTLASIWSIIVALFAPISHFLSRVFVTIFGDGGDGHHGRSE